MGLFSAFISKPENFDSTENYIAHLQKEVELTSKEKEKPNGAEADFPPRRCRFAWLNFTGERRRSLPRR